MFDDKMTSNAGCWSSVNSGSNFLNLKFKVSCLIFQLRYLLKKSVFVDTLYAAIENRFLDRFDGVCLKAYKERFL